ncbi:uncharacterized protein [Eleutherodactylus coqui]|uniref:uncharacterized protein n=1 Tax=Eleutherodactylus coqui TaxID=57060 RepID=UPI003461A8EB
MSKKRKKPSHVCEVCHVFCSSALHLSDHIGGSKHRKAVSEESPEFLANLQRLEYFLDTYLKDEPMIGLEYIVEFPNDGMYTYKCLLCDTQTPRGTTILHLCGSKHRRAYLEKHHPNLVVLKKNYSKRSQYTYEIKTAALQVERLHGRKRILDAENKKEDGPMPAKIPKMPSRVTPEELPPLKGASQQVSSECKSGKENVIVKTEKTNQLSDFTTNNEFLDYLRSFEIRSDGDASFIQTITKNCTKALMKYREEQTNAQVSSTMTSNGDPKNNQNPSDKANFSTMNSPKESSASAQIPPIFQKSCDATEVFFNSIKNMDTSEVVNILNKIAATNPAFRGINIPSLIKYLQETGRLKN